MVLFSHSFKIPASVFEGRGCCKILPQRLVESRVKRVVVVMDSNVHMSPWGEALKQDIEDHISSVDTWSDVEPNVPSQLVQLLADRLNEIQPDAVIAVGGGSTIDLAKAGLAVSETGLSVRDLLMGKWGHSDSITPIYAVPTTCGTGSEGSPFAVVLLEEERVKHGFRRNAIVPKEAYLDPDALLSLPIDYIAATGIDACCHAIETFLSIKASPFSDCSVLGSALTAYTNIHAATLGDIDARAALLSASFSSRLMSPGVGLTMAHAISHPLGARYGLHHGKAVALGIIPSLRFNLPYAREKIARLARYLLPSCPAESDDVAEAFIESFQALLLSISLNIPSLLLSDNEIREVAELALQSSNVSSNPAPVDLATTIRLVSESIA